MQAMVLEKACIQCGLCAGLCPEVFALNSGEPARVTVDPIPGVLFTFPSRYYTLSVTK